MARFEYKVASIVALLRCVPAVLGQKDFLGAVCIDSCDNGMRCLKLSGGAFEDCQATSIDVDDPCTCGGVGEACFDSLNCLQCLVTSGSRPIPHVGNSSIRTIPLRQSPALLDKLPENIEPCFPCAGGEADPFYSGFNGKTFYFIGAPDETFNLLSEEVRFLTLSDFISLVIALLKIARPAEPPAERLARGLWPAT